ncbi:MAG: thiamine phosphate synthase [Clostridiales bacterium]|nr:thiamine phosphate synthase [Clostridiales bacterium]
MRQIDYTLYLCTDRNLMSSGSLEECVESAVKGGVTVVQLREKDCSSREFYDIGLKIRQITRAYGVPLIINDRVDIAIAVGADGVHIGQSDLSCTTVRRIVGKDMIIGVTAHNLQEAMQAVKDGADYLGVGAMRATGTKKEAKVISPDELIAIRKNINLPIVIIGGINKGNVCEFKGKGLDGIAVVSAIVSQPNVEQAARELKELWTK